MPANMAIWIYTKAMTTEKMKVAKQGGGGFAYCLGFIGAAVYYIQQAEGFWMGVLGILKALVWPAILVYQLLNTLSA
jgi:hypothetical protein